jgi:class 3 adenylate cyclase
VLAPSAFAAVEPSVDAEPLGELNLKGFQKPVPAYLVTSSR